MRHSANEMPEWLRMATAFALFLACIACVTAEFAVVASDHGAAIRLVGCLACSLLASISLSGCVRLMAGG